MDFVQIFITSSVLVCHVLCTENEIVNQGESLKDGLRNEIPPGYIFKPFKRRTTLNWFHQLSTIKPYISSHGSSGKISNGLILMAIILSTFAVVAIFCAIKFWCLNSYKESTSRQQRSNVNVRPSPTIFSTVRSPPERSNATVNHGYSTFPESNATLGINSETAIGEGVDVPPTYTAVVMDDFSEMPEKKFPPAMKVDLGAIAESPPPDYTFISAQKF